MTISTKTITETWSPDGTGINIQQTFTPSTGELYYIESVRLENISEGSGSSYFSAIVRKGSASNENNITSAEVDAINPSAGTPDVYGSSLGGSETAQFGRYLTPDHVLYVCTDDGGNSDSSTFEIMVEMRQVL